VSIGRVLLLVFGSIGLLVAVVLLVGSGFLLWFNSAKKDSDGFFTSGTHEFKRTSHAITSEDIDIDMDVPGWFDPDDFVSLRFTASNNDPSKEVFLGIAADSDVKAYLAGVEHHEITKLEIIPFELEYRRHAGDSTPAPPTVRPFWTESAYGAGTQTLTWPIEKGVWSFVVMNGDGSAGVDVDMKLGAKVPLVLGIGVGLLVAGILVLLAGSTMVFFGARTQPGENDSPDPKPPFMRSSQIDDQN
jgi:hypothetical protein